MSPPPKRAKSIAAPRTVKPASEELAGAPPHWSTWLGLAWLVGFCVYFYSFGLPNNPEWTRPAIWLQLPELLPVSSVLSARWSNLWQRADLFGLAAVMLAGAWGLGMLVLRLVRPLIGQAWAERTVLAMGLGLGASSLVTLALGLAGLLYRWLFLAIIAAAIAAEVALRARERRGGAPAGRTSGRDVEPPALRTPTFWVALATMVPFLIVMWLGSMSPDREFDVREYHFEGPKEYFQNGRITFLPHNVYTNFPFLNEMLVLQGMVLRGDWYWGALAGKCVLFAYAPLTALGLYAAGRRWFNSTAGVLAALVYLTTPWIDRITTFAYVESGLAFFLFAALLAAMMAIERMREGAFDWRTVLLAGLLAGSGMACKYTGVMQVVAPIGAAIAVAPWFVAPPPPDASRLKASLVAAAIFTIGVTITIGPWLLKNVAETGNPIYPLGYAIFGGADLTPELNARFQAGHTARTPRTFFQGMRDVVADNDWSSPLWYGLAPLALFLPTRRRMSAALWLFVGYLFVTWWRLTHQIDRFWVPMIPVVSLLAGIGATWREDAVWRWGRNAVVALAVLFNFVFETGSDPSAGMETWYLCGPNVFLADITRAREMAEQKYVAFLNQTLPKNAKVLCAGEAEVFEARFPVVYNTVFDESIFENWFAVKAPGTPDDRLKLKPAAEIRAKLQQEGITHVYVNWSEIRRYRSPGSYGYTRFVTPTRFDQLVAEGVLGVPQTLGVLDVGPTTDEKAIAALQMEIERGKRVLTEDGMPIIVTGLTQLSDQDRATLKEIGPSLLRRADGREVVINAQVFPVR